MTISNGDFKNGVTWSLPLGEFAPEADMFCTGVDAVSFKIFLMRGHSGTRTALKVAPCEGTWFVLENLDPRRF